jgi:hypothetical protein
VQNNLQFLGVEIAFEFLQHLILGLPRMADVTPDAARTGIAVVR